MIQNKRMEEIKREVFKNYIETKNYDKVWNFDVYSGKFDPYYIYEGRTKEDLCKSKEMKEFLTKLKKETNGNYNIECKSEKEWLRGYYRTHMYIDCEKIHQKEEIEEDIKYFRDMKKEYGDWVPKSKYEN